MSRDTAFRPGWLYEDPYDCFPAGIADDPVALALAPYRYGWPYDESHGHGRSWRPTSPPTRSRRRHRSPSPPPPSLQAATSSRPRSRSARIPASSKAILGLKEVELTTTVDDSCAICLKALADPDQEEEDEEMTRLRAMPCSHIFHQHCIFSWLGRNAACPLCRQRLPTTDDEEDDED